MHEGEAVARGRDRGEGRGVYIKRFGILGIRSGCKLRFQFSSVFMCGDETKYRNGEESLYGKCLPRNETTQV